jgi:hypothetical protein
MNTDELTTMIRDLETNELTLSNARNLASLYIVRDHLQSLVQSKTEKELSDILPSYKNYIQIKTRYQKHEISKDFVCASLKMVCKEVKEFIHTLYSSTDMPDERNLITTMIHDLKETL